MKLASRRHGEGVVYIDRCATLMFKFLYIEFNQELLRPIAMFFIAV